MTTSAEPVRPGPLAARTVIPAPRLLRLPGVYRPQEDTALLAAAIADLAIRPGARALDLCTGTGAQAITLARRGARTVLAVDLSRRALASARFNALVRQAAVRPCRGDLATAVRQGPYDVVVANPPYVPAPAPAVRATRGWDAGPDGRAVLDPLCAAAGTLLRPGGTLLIVQSGLSDVDKSWTSLAAQGLWVSVARRARIPFGPVLSGRTAFLEAAGLIAPGQRTEELVVLRADR
ncbi:release factor glutamine methyltransferase [Amycolatopsis lexingtonensis]|uniref:Release factor glutamine methyltransferase n=1 Tax=Amycolatopsis lexingtonensis TaxID=218822 RepID=A0ABR9HS60_9PSEU|nr:HemK2/MTQ2 family protein methyltransferase [Amycolatopsis lexingtonensis]MBE1493765.1 release factor glutamine methyltransferase [Amycolatopsis lexingtonensis]